MDATLPPQPSAALAAGDTREARLALLPPGALAAAARVLAPAAALGWAADALFYGRQPGVSFPLFVVLLVATLFAVARRERVAPAWRNLWLLAPLFFFGVMVAVRANGLLTVLNVGAAAVLLCLTARFFSGGRLEALGLLGYPAAVAAAAGGALSRPVAPVALTGRAAAQQRGKLRRALPVLRGALLALPVLALFTSLLVAADSIFAGYVEDALNVEHLVDLPERLWRLVLMSVVAWLVAGGLLVALRRHEAAAAPTPWPDRTRLESSDGEAEALHHQESRVPLLTNLRLGFGESATVLALVDVLFALFVWVQLAYLFSGEAARTMHFEEYRLYARRGFGELLVVSVLTLFLIVGLRAVTWRPGWRVWQAVGGPESLFRPVSRQVRVFNALSTVMVGLTLVMLASAFQRMLLWEQVEFYINTGTRLYVRWFIVWLGLTFIWLVATLWRRPERFAVGLFAAALGFLATVNLQDPDADVAAFNLARRDDLATRYLALLSDDAVPALAARLSSPDGAGALPEKVRADLRADLRRRLERLERQALRGWSDWPSFHVGRWRARRALQALDQQGHL